MENKKDLNFTIIAMTAQGEGISGGDRISIEFIRRWSQKYPVTVCLWQEGYRMYLRNNLDPKKINFKLIDMNPWLKMGFVINYISTIIAGILFALRVKIDNKKSSVVYSATEFWMDSLPGLILKLRFPEITWITTWFQTAPNPLIGFKEGDRVSSYRFPAFLYWFVQLPIKPLIKKYADLVLVNNEDERKQFPKMDKNNKVIVTLGAVDLPLIKKLTAKIKDNKKVFDGVFQGRFHPQKGIVELIDIWRLVVDQKKDAKLAVIGGGPLDNKVRERIKELNLANNVTLFGFVFDGEKKFTIFKQSRVVLHPAFYDSGGMASAEAMALGLPAVGFDLSSYESYYPRGMIKVPINDFQAFAQAVLELLKVKSLYSKTADEAKKMISKNWSWDIRSNKVLERI